MSLRYAIIETRGNLTVAPIETGATAAAVAARMGGVVVDAGPFATYQDACDALAALQEDDEEDSY